LTGAGNIPTPSDAVLIRLAGIAARVEELLAPDNPLDKAPVGLKTIKNDRRRATEGVLVLLADSEVRNYLQELERLGLLPVKRPA
jgi:hypothetical protein